MIAMAEPTHFVNIALIYTIEPKNDPGSGIAIPHVVNVDIPPYDNQADIDNFVRHAIHEHVDDAITEDYGVNPFRKALLAAAAKLVRLEQVFALLPGNAPRRDLLAQIINASNDQAIALWGENPEG